MTIRKALQEYELMKLFGASSRYPLIVLARASLWAIASIGARCVSYQVSMTSPLFTTLAT